MKGLKIHYVDIEHLLCVRPIPDTDSLQYTQKDQIPARRA